MTNVSLLRRVVRRKNRGLQVAALSSVYVLGYISSMLGAATWFTQPGSQRTEPADCGSSIPHRRLLEDVNSTTEAPRAGDYPPDLFTLEQKRKGAITLHVFMMVYMFVALAIVCDEFFVPALGVITEKLHLSEDVAGATFMAAGGSAPELFTSYIGVFIAHNNVGIGTIVGSAVFNILFVIGMCAIFSKELLVLTWWPLFRDVSFYSIDLVMLVVFFLDGVIHWYEAFVLLLLYVCYVTFMKFNPQIEGKVKSVLCCCEGNKVASMESLLNERRGIDVRRRHSSMIYHHGIVQLMVHTIDPLTEDDAPHESDNVTAEDERKARSGRRSSDTGRPLRYEVEEGFQPHYNSKGTLPKSEGDVDKKASSLQSKKSSQASSGIRSSNASKDSEGDVDKKASSLQSKKSSQASSGIRGSNASKDSEWGDEKKDNLGQGTDKMASLRSSASASEDSDKLQDTVVKLQAVASLQMMMEPKDQEKQAMSINVISNGKIPASPVSTRLSGTPDSLDTAETGFLDRTDNSTMESGNRVNGVGSRHTANNNNNDSNNDNNNVNNSIDVESNTSSGDMEEEEPPLDISWPEGWRKRLTYIFLAPIVLPLWLLLPDVRRPESKKWYVVTFLGSIVAIAFFSYIMVWMASETGLTIGISANVMGLTILAAGTSIPDLITSVIVAKKGFGDMAVSSSVGSNIFDITMGLPLPWLTYAAIFNGAPLSVNSHGLLCSILLLFGMLIALIIVIAAFRWKMSPMFGVMMLLSYVAFLVLSILFELEFIGCPKVSLG